jgi:hypothetical protein
MALVWSRWDKVGGLSLHQENVDFAQSKKLQILKTVLQIVTNEL